MVYRAVPLATLLRQASTNRGTQMAYGVVHQFAGGTKEQYEASVGAVHPSDGSLPEGQVFHAAGPSADGWTIVAIHNSKESWEQFRDTTLGPKMAAGIAGGFTAPPQETTFEVVSQTTS
jgi:hypothetical protein